MQFAPDAKEPRSGRAQAEMVFAPFASTTMVSPYGMNQAIPRSVRAKPYEMIFYEKTRFPIKDVGNDKTKKAAPYKRAAFSVFGI